MTTKTVIDFLLMQIDRFRDWLWVKLFGWMVGM
jgi:hypothetical protein